LRARRLRVFMFMARSATPSTPSRLDLLEQDEEHFQRFAESSDDVYWLADLPSGRLVFVSPRFERFWGVSRERLLEDPTLWNQAVFEEDRHVLPTPFFADDPSSQQALREYRIEGPGGQCHWMRDRRFHLRNRSGRTVRIGGIAEDVSVRKAREIELDGLLTRERAARAEAEAAVRSKDEFLSVVTHELRSPLNAIRGWAHVLRRCGGLSEMQVKALDAIDRNTVTQAQMVDDLLDSQRILCGNFRLELSRVPLSQLIAEAVEAVQPAADAKHIQIEVTNDPAIAQVSVDLARLRQALTGLLSNAVKFTPDNGRIEVRSLAGAGEVAIEVQDNGIGLEPSQLPLVFDRFQQADSAWGCRWRASWSSCTVGRSRSKVAVSGAARVSRSTCRSPIWRKPAMRWPMRPIRWPANALSSSKTTTMGARSWR